MTPILVDTSAYSAFLRGHSDLRGLFREVRELVLTPVVLGELRAGFRGGLRRASNEAALESFLASPRVRVTPVDDGTSERYADIFSSLRRAGTPIGLNDVWIAASAQQHGLRLVTTDGDFKRVPNLAVDVYPAL